MVGGHANQEMDVVASSVDAESRASDLPNDASEVGMEVLFEFGLDEERSVVWC